MTSRAEGRLSCRAMTTLRALLAGSFLFFIGCDRAPTAPASSNENADSALFVERAAELGLDFVHFNGMSGALYFAEMMGPGVALFDSDQDGDLDVLALQGQMLGPKKLEEATFPPTPAQLPLRARLFRNELEKGEVRFVDVTESSGLDARGYAMGVVTGDIDNDGDLDLYLLNFGANQMWRNRGDGSFENATTAANLAATGWSVSGTFFDYDRDGFLDLYLANYVDFAVEQTKPCRALTGAPDYCGPLTHQPLHDRLFRNRGNGTFEDRSAPAGINGVVPASGLGVVDFDADGDGWPDLFVANDGMPNFLWLNQGDGTFLESAVIQGCSVNQAGQAEAGMGIAVGDYDRDADEDLLITHLTLETNTLYRNDGKGFFEDRTLPSGLGSPSLEFTGFGTAFFDLGLDGWLDLITTNGTVKLLPDLVATRDPLPLDQRLQLFKSRGDGTFAELGDAAGPAFARPEVGRGLAWGDVDNDGDTDILISNNAGPLRLLINESPRGHWLSLHLLDRFGKDALGAEVRWQADGRTQVARVRTSGSYASASDPRIVIGLGAFDQLKEVRVRWPDGREEVFDLPALDRFLRIEQGRGRRD
jgi:enediyne biosynthesis protein E4